jgi:hypothetical protein
MIDCLTNTEMKMNMSKIEEIVRECADECFTKEMLLSGSEGETWDLHAQIWLDEHYPDITDDERSRFSTELDRYHAICAISAYEEAQEEKEALKKAEAPVSERMTKSELLAKIKELAKALNFSEASLLMKVYRGL